MRTLSPLTATLQLGLLATLTLVACGSPGPTDDDSPFNQGDGDGSGVGAQMGDGDGDGDGFMSTGGGMGSSGGDGDGDMSMGSGSQPGGGNGSGSAVGDGDGDGDGDGMSQPYLPARIRRLTNAEYSASVQALLNTDEAPGAVFPPDTRQQGYTVNEAQRVAPLLAKTLDTTAIRLASEAVANLDSLAPCAATTPAAEEVCASEFASQFATKAYRRSLEPSELDALLQLYRAGVDGGDYSEGIELLIRGVLQAPAFLYVTEIGDYQDADVVELTPHEIASSLSYVLTGAPPDDALHAAAVSGALSTPEGRQAEVRRLLSGPDGKERIVRIVREWLGIDRIAATAKDSNVYPGFDQLRDAMESETSDFVHEALATENGNVSTLLGADWTIASPALADLYGTTGDGKISVPARPGLLNQGAFLSVYSHAHETGPVLRGVTVMRRVACLNITLPASLSSDIIPPVPDPEKTTRERFDIHSAAPACQGCHSKIDPLGFSFEHLDGMGALRTEENGKAIDSTATVVLGADFDGYYADSGELARALSTSAEVRECFARQIFRATSGEGVGAESSENAFINAWEALPEADQGSIVEILVTMAQGNVFSQRGAQ